MNKEFLKLAVPNILTNLTIPLVSLVDLGLMGHLPRSEYILAIGFGTVIFSFIYWAFGFLRMGTTGMVSQAYGRPDEKEIQEVLIKGMLVAFIGGILLILIQYPLRELAIRLILPEKEVMAPLITYFNWRIYAAPATIMVYAITGWLLGMQDSKSALYVAMLINGGNALFSFILVVYGELGIIGVALGTLLAQYLGLTGALLILYRKYNIRFKKLVARGFGSISSWKSFLGVNIDILLRTLFLIFVLSFFKAKAGNMGLLIGAANILLLEFLTLAAYGIDGFAFAAEAICGKYFGMKERKLFRKAVNYAFAWGLGFSALISLCFFVFGVDILNLLTDKEVIVEAALSYLPWLIIAPLVNSIAFIWDGIYIGCTASKAMKNTMFISAFLVFLPLFYFFREYYGNHGIWLALTLFMFSRGVLQSLLARWVIFNRID